MTCRRHWLSKSARAATNAETQAGHGPGAERELLGFSRKGYLDQGRGMCVCERVNANLVRQRDQRCLLGEFYKNGLGMNRALCLGCR